MRIYKILIVTLLIRVGITKHIGKVEGLLNLVNKNENKTMFSKSWQMVYKAKLLFFNKQFNF